MTSLLIPYQQTPPTTMDSTASTSTVGSPLPRPPSVGQLNSASSTPSPAHHASLHQTSCLATSDSDEVDTAVKSIAGKNEHSQNTKNQTDDDDKQCLDDSDNTVIMEVKDQTCTGTDGDNTAEVRGQNVIGAATEMKGQQDTLVSEEDNDGRVRSNQEGSSGNDTTTCSTTVPNGGIANRHLLMVEQHHRCNGLNDTTTTGSTASRRVLANVLTQHPPSSVVIELKDLTHVENGRLLNTEKNHLSSNSTLPPHPHPLVTGEIETSTILNPNPSKGLSEPILTNRTQPSHKTSVLLVDAMTEDTASHTEAESNSRNDKLNASVMTSSTENGETVGGDGGHLPLGVDGLPCSLDPLQKRVRELELQHRREVAELRVSLKEAQLQVHVLGDSSTEITVQWRNFKWQDF